MTGFRFTPQALDDLFDIWNYIAQDNPEAADRVEQAIYNACKLLARSPPAGAVRKDLSLLTSSAFLAGRRSRIISSYTIPKPSHWK
jgi:plasmid stabilization system protein ParE